MSKLDLTKIAETVLSQQQIERKITEYKVFYKTYLTTVKNREEVLNKLYRLCTDFQRTKPTGAFSVKSETAALEREAEKTLKEHFNPAVLKFYHKEIPMPDIKRKLPDFDESFWPALLSSLAITFENMNEQSKREWAYKTNFLIYLCNCLSHHGLHPDILRRDPRNYKRYNFLLEHYFKSRIKIAEQKILLKPMDLQQEFLNPYEKKLPIKIRGKLIPFKSIYSIKITSTLLFDDEIELYAAKNQFTWNSRTKDELSFIQFCQDETDNLLKNPYLLDDKSIEKFRNNNAYFVHPRRIKELPHPSKIGFE